MKKILFIILLIPFILYAQSYIISSIPLPKTYIQDLDPYPCDEVCMQEYLDNGMIFSFLSHANSKLENKLHDEIRVLSVSILNLGSNINGDKFRIALLLPYKKIGKYSLSTTNSSFAYLITKNHPFDLKSYKIEHESIKDINSTINKIKKDGFNYIIAPLTQDGAKIITNINPNIHIYIPTINKKDANTSSPYLYFGGIDYQAQSDILLREAVSPLVVFYDKSKIGKRLALYEENKFNSMESIAQSEIPENNENRVVIKYSIPKRTTNLEPHLKENEKIQKASFFINTPVVKSGMIMSQLTLYDANATNVLSTQINYDPLLLSMTQYIDRKNMIVANSITQHNNVFIETNSLLGNDIVYDWINYSTTIGIDYFFNMATNVNREYEIEILDNQVQYPIKLLKASKSKFIDYISNNDSNKSLEELSNF